MTSTSIARIKKRPQPHPPFHGAFLDNKGGRDAAELRRLDLPDVRQRRSGALLSFYRYLGKHLKLGAGYNFTDFSDDLTDLSYRHQGVFINIVGNAVKHSDADKPLEIDITQTHVYGIDVTDETGDLVCVARCTIAVRQLRIKNEE